MLFVHSIGDNQIRIWGLSSRERLARQIKQIGDVRWIDDLSGLPEGASVLISHSDYVMEVRTLEELLQRSDTVLCAADGQPAVAIVSASKAQPTADLLLSGRGVKPGKIQVIDASALGNYDRHLRRAKPPLLEPVSERTRVHLENKLYGSAYKGITDLVTKWLWPGPAKSVVRRLADLRATPNMVTTVGAALMVAAGILFFNGQYVPGLAAAWIMTFLDTVDGKLARVTVQSTRFGHYLDHGIDLLHPPFWYVFWGMSLTGLEPVLGFGQSDLYWVIGIGYVLGRAAEALFHLLGDCSIFTWRPFDAYFRLITARRNPCLIILTGSVAVGRPDWGFIGVAVWTAVTTTILLGRLLQGTLARSRSGPLHSWLSDPETAAAQHAYAYRLFSSTRGAFA
jgi:hypothetical protein